VRHEDADVRLRVPAVTSVETAQRIREVLGERSFHPVYQPIYSLRGGRLVAVEALTRFDGEPARSPAWWFEQAERAGMSVALDLAAIEAALDGAEGLPDHVVLHLNATPPTLRDLRFLALLDAHPHRQVAVELTEHAAVEDYQRLGPARRGLREREVRLVVDDAGAGFSSLRHVLRLEPEIIKLDISLTRDIGSNSAHHALARSLVLFAEQAGSQLIPEGIENVADLRAWQRLGADAAQGFLLGRPGPLPATDPCPAIPGRAPALARRRTGSSRTMPARRSGPAAR
jgi:EAL domain-containing protein (putative c-di-GMP-specific phosphodiesterase class I)